ncbi:MAG: hypothetical protein GY928_32725 [Colwellia sp.]|nr:hypothetical protein [Colwellia sp.]
MEYVEALEKLGFSFWQLLIIGFAIVLRHEVRALFSRLASVKVGDKELAFHEDKSVSDLKAVKEQLESQPSEPEKAISLINEKIDNKLISALGAIKRETRFLWPAIETLESNYDSKAEIQRHTFDKVKSNLQVIEDAGLLTYDLEFVGPQQYGIREIRLKKLDNRLDQLINAVSNKSSNNAN